MKPIPKKWIGLRTKATCRCNYVSFSFCTIERTLTVTKTCFWDMIIHVLTVLSLQLVSMLPKLACYMDFRKLLYIFILIKFGCHQCVVFLTTFSVDITILFVCIMLKVVYCRLCKAWYIKVNSKFTHRNWHVEHRLYNMFWTI